MSRLQPFRDEFAKYRRLGEAALARLPDAALNRIAAPELNSAAMLVRHIGGNLVSRFTDFLTTDGEKPWRERDREFEERQYSRAEVDAWWQRGWQALDEALAPLHDAALDAQVTVRGERISVQEALVRASAHIAYHVGQLVLLSRLEVGAEWASLSIPKGGSAAYRPGTSVSEGGTAR